MPDLLYSFVPGAAESGFHVGSYRRRLPVSLVRMYENALIGSICRIYTSPVSVHWSCWMQVLGVGVPR